MRRPFVSRFVPLLASPRSMPTRALSALSALSLAALALLGCSGTGQPEVTYQASATVEPPSSIQAGDFTVTLTDAKLAFGPVYFCASASGSATLCESAVAELTEIRAVDLLASSAQPLGDVHGLTGAIRSASYDFGVHWFLTEETPTAAPVAPGGHSAHFEGDAIKPGTTIHFVADVDVIPQYQGQRAVPSADARADVTASTDHLDVHFDPAAWLAQVDFDEAPSAPGTYAITAGSRNHGALVIAMTSQKPPAFTWSALP